MMKKYSLKPSVDSLALAHVLSGAQTATDPRVGVIAVHGIIGRGWGDYEKKILGCIDVLDIHAAIATAEREPNIQSILLDIDSPGGMVTGTPELGDTIGNCSKPIFAFTAGEMASAAYWLGCATNRIYATKSATIGSIGVYTPHVDSSKAMDQQGLRVDLIKSGPFKGAGFPGTSLTAEQRQVLQDHVNSIYEMFTSHVLAHRPGVSADAMQGQVFLAEDARRRGLIDEVI